jgi:hypothetical protein
MNTMYWDPPKKSLRDAHVLDSARLASVFLKSGQCEIFTTVKGLKRVMGPDSTKTTVQRALHLLVYFRAVRARVGGGIIKVKFQPETLSRLCDASANLRTTVRHYLITSCTSRHCRRRRR